MKAINSEQQHYNHRGSRRLQCGTEYKKYWKVNNSIIITEDQDPLTDNEEK